MSLHVQLFLEAPILVAGDHRVSNRNLFSFYRKLYSFSLSENVTSIYKQMHTCSCIRKTMTSV